MCPSQFYLKLSDFGLCRQAIKDQLMTTRCGTILYCAPEIFQNCPYDGMKADIWSSGIMLFVMASGHFPWVQLENVSDEVMMQDAIKQICACNIEYPDNLSYPLLELLHRMLSPDPNYRPTAMQVLEHPWFKELSQEEIARYELTNPTETYVVEMVEETIGELMNRQRLLAISSMGPYYSSYET